jgi:hypothetical protein
MDYTTGITHRWHQVSSYNWPDEVKGPWTISLGWREVRGRMECVGVAITEKEPAYGAPYPPAEVITRQMVRKIPVGDYIKRTRPIQEGVAETVARLYEAEGNPEDAARVRDYGRRFSEGAPAPGRPHKWGDDHYREVARAYTVGYGKGYPTKYVARHFSTPGGHQVSHSTAARWVRECRKRGYLGDAPEKGVAGGVLPPEQKEGK